MNKAIVIEGAGRREGMRKSKGNRVDTGVKYSIRLTWYPGCDAVGTGSPHPLNGIAHLNGNGIGYVYPAAHPNLHYNSWCGRRSWANRGWRRGGSWTRGRRWAWRSRRCHTRCWRCSSARTIVIELERIDSNVIGVSSRRSPVLHKIAERQSPSSK